MNRMIVSGLCLAMVSGCAARPSQIDGTYVSPAIYKDYTCDQLLSERRTIVENVRVITKQQADKAGGDAVAVGVGVVLFWPALFLLAAGKDREAELASYKGTTMRSPRSLSRRSACRKTKFAVRRKLTRKRRSGRNATRRSRTRTTEFEARVSEAMLASLRVIFNYHCVSTSRLLPFKR